MARAMPTRCSWPPESSRGRCSPGRRGHQPERRRHALAPLVAAHVAQQQRQLHVALGREHRQEVVHLEHEADVVGAPARERRLAELVDAQPVDLQAAGGRAVETAD